ncbi:MAG: EamA family transporter [Bacteroidia bacterium]|nr:EamA family transporter [Bacteroidia bacterium]
MNTGKTIKGHAAVFSSNLIYGLNYVIAKGIMPGYLTPRSIIFIRVSGAMILFWIIDGIFVKEKIEKKDLLKIAFYSVFGIAVNQIMFFEGLNLTTPINSSIIMTITPILVLALSFFIIKDTITVVKIAGILAGVAGAIMLILKTGEVSFNSNTFTGNLFTFINATSFGLYLVLIKSMAEKYNPVTLMKWLFTFGFILITPFCLSNFIHSDFHSIPLSIWLSILYVVIAATFLGYLLYNYALVVLSPAATSSYIYLQPAIATIVALILGKDTLGWQEIVSGLLIFLGVFMVSYQKKTN